MSHLSLRTNPDDEIHLELLEKTLGLSRSEAARTALSIAADFIAKQKPDKLLILKNSEFIGADCSNEATRIGFRKKIKHKLVAKYGLQQSEKPHR